MRTGETIDKQEMPLLEAEKLRWKVVLTRLTAIALSLAVRNLALRGHTEKLFFQSNGNFFKEVELMAKSDPIMQKGTSSPTLYFGHHMQNELTDVLSNKTISAIMSDIKQSKVLSIIVDCTPDISHTEQLSVVIRVVLLKGKTHIMEHFMGFLEADESTGQHLACLIQKKLEKLKLLSWTVEDNYMTVELT
ncbi:uncharacterized protein LOC135223977 [Macrobrachium nipponense]|uniref:uncharacterized protein LOC135223977 n=1 Tax=Macrobrachium nipponense TaxID=159736 RepID=UPI0030C81C18